MTEKQIIEEVLRYLTDESYNYAVLIDGEWGSGKTYFVQKILKEQMEEAEKETNSHRKIKYLSLYGCKSIQDIQENIIWGLADEVENRTDSKKSQNERSSNTFLTTKKIINGLCQRFIPEINPVDIATDWIKMKSYIFIFDDIERCDCPLNEVFGFINGLVEHEGTKVILVANEKEIAVNREMSQRELQYLVLLNDKIKWEGEKESYAYGMGNDAKDKISIELLEERRKIVFSDDEVDEVYQKIREKLIGVTLKYQPDIRLITKEIIEKSKIITDLKEELLTKLDFFSSFMDTNNHHNLRTFQFFLSKMCYLYGRFMEIDIEEEYKKETLSFLIQDCFKCAVRFKGNIPIPVDSWEKALYDEEKKLIVTKEYVETGKYNEKMFEVEIKKYIKEELKEKLSERDPLSLLYNGYYFHNQQWCEERLQEVKKRLEENKYPVHMYTKLILLLIDFVKIGFSETYLLDFKEIMKVNITVSSISAQISDDLFYVDDNQRKQKAKEIIRELNLAIVEKETKQKQKDIEEILSEDDWMRGLKEYVESEIYIYSTDQSVFCKSTSEKWLQALKRATVEDIDIFRRWLHQTYSRQLIIRENLRADLPIIKEIAEKIILEEEMDLIKKLNLRWLKENMERIVISNEK